MKEGIEGNITFSIMFREHNMLTISYMRLAFAEMPTGEEYKFYVNMLGNRFHTVSASHGY